MENTVEFFIDRVRHNPCLWNQSHVAYRDMAKKDVTWERIARECRMLNGKEAKLQWKRLRDSHREALRRRKPSFGPSAQYLKPWKYEDDMKFILSQIDNKESVFWSNDTHDVEAVEDNDSEAMDMNHASREIAMPVPIKLPEKQDVTIEPLYTDPDTKRDVAEMLEERDRLREEREKHRDELLLQALALNRSDALSKFFDSLCQKTRELPRYLQLRVQREIFESVTRAEEESLSLNPTSLGYNPMPSSSTQERDVRDNDDSQEQDYAIDNEYEPKFSVDN